MKCGAHERCEDTSGVAICGCVVGYKREAADAKCTWNGGPDDPTFSSATSNWKVKANASIDASIGVARLRGDGAVSQAFDMPSFADAEPLAMEIQAGCKGQCGNITGSLMAVSMGDRAIDLTLPTQGLAPRRVCLGDRAYGRTVSLAVTTFSPATTLAGPDEDAMIDSIRFVAAPECPAPGEVANADFEKSGGWTTGGTGITEVASGLGTNGSRAGRLVATGCEKPNLATTISVPEGLARPALAFSFRGTRDREGSVSLDNKPIASLRGTGAFEQAVVCLPEWTRGFAHALRITAGERYSACNLPGVNEVIIDDFKIVSSDSCSPAPSVVDGGFERSFGASSSWFEGVTDGASVAVIRGDVASARSGSSLLQLSTFTCSRQIIADQTVSAPARPVAGGGGPALKFWYRVVNGGAGIVPMISVGPNFDSLPNAAIWTERKLCMPASSWGRSQYLGFSLSAQTGSCSASLQVDDVSVAIDPGCPAD